MNYGIIFQQTTVFKVFVLLSKADNLHKGICRTVGPTLAASLELFSHCWNVVRIRLVYLYFILILIHILRLAYIYFGRCSYELVELVPLLYSYWMPIRYFNRLYDFAVTIPKCFKNVCVNSLFPCTARL